MATLADPAPALTAAPSLAGAALGVECSVTGQAWRWRRHALDRRHAAEGPPGALDELVTEMLLSRGVPRDELARHRSPALRELMPDPSLFRDMDRAAARLADAVEAGERVAVYGDYDVDGATSAALLIRLLRELGLDPVAYIPDRLLEGYGPSGAALVRLAGEGAGLIVTVDCGAMAHEALAAAAAVPVDVIVVDHHKCSADLPAAYALVNPSRLDEGAEAIAHRHLAAVGMAFLLGVALVRELRRRGRFAAGAAEPDLMALLDLVALGTVADMAALTGLNRALVAQGLKVMARRGNAGLAALIDASRLQRAPACSDLGFALGPRINAGGRVGAADLGVRLLTTRDPAEAAAIARELDRLNEDRRRIEAEVQAEAEAAIPPGGTGVAIVAGRGWHPGVIGIVAGRLKERLGRPALVVALDGSGPGGVIGKGSGRSVPGVDLGAAVIAARAAGLLLAGGGHAMACGITVAEDRLEALAAFLDERLGAAIARSQAQRALLLDLAVAPGGLTPALVETMERAGPYGIGWPGPRIVAGPVRLVKAERVGTGDHVRAIAAGADGRSFKAMAFRAGDTPLGDALLNARGRRLWLAGRPKIDDWGARPTAELHIEDAAWAE